MNIEMSVSEQITYSTVLIKCQYSDGTSGSGTGFLVNLFQGEEADVIVPALITNRHVVENSVNVCFEFCKADDVGNPVDTETVPVVCSGNSWICHPNKDVDLSCLLLGEILNRMQQAGIKVFHGYIGTNLIPTSEQREEFTAMENVVMVGYPTGLSDTYNHKPIIRQGITASHPNKDYQGKKEVLLDIAVYPGSSGSPVFLFNQGAYATSKRNFIVGDRLFFLGIMYAAPVFTAEGEFRFTHLPNVPTVHTGIPMNLGRMIKAERILDFKDVVKEIIEGSN